MKRFKFLLVLIAIAGAFSANALQQKTDPLYHLENGEMVLITEEGRCAEVAEETFCKYVKQPNTPDSSDPIYYDPAPDEVSGFNWEPLAR